MVDTAERQRLEALQALGVLDTPPEERFDRIARLAQHLFRVPMVGVTLIDRDRQWLKSGVGLPAVDVRREDAFCAHTIRQPGPMIVTDAQRDPRFADNPFVVNPPHVRFYCGQPLTAGGQRVGALCLLDDEPREMTPEDISLLADLSSWVESELAIRDELERAEQVQRGLLPRAVPDVPGYEVAGGCVPASLVGGDFFDWYREGDSLQLTIADVMGKGVGSAIIAATVRAVLRSTSRGTGVGDAVTAAARSLEPDLDETSAFVTLFTARLDPESGLIRYVDAGHGLTLRIDAAGVPERLPAVDLPLGAAPEYVWTEQRIELRPGETLISVSDGLLDFFRTAPEVLEAASILVRGTSSAAEAVGEIRRFTSARRAHDDVTALVLKRVTA